MNASAATYAGFAAIKCSAFLLMRRVSILLVTGLSLTLLFELGCADLGRFALAQVRDNSQTGASRSFEMPLGPHSDPGRPVGQEMPRPGIPVGHNELTRIKRKGSREPIKARDDFRNSGPLRKSRGLK